MSESIKPSDPSEIIKAQISTVTKIINDETWYEGERRHCPVESSDFAVKEKVNKIILECGEQMRRDAVKKLDDMKP